MAELVCSIRVVLLEPPAPVSVVVVPKVISPTDVISTVSIQIQFECDAGFLVPVTSTVKLCDPGPMPGSEKISWRQLPGVKYVSTVARRVPSKNTFAMPAHSSLQPNHFSSPVPVNETENLEPASRASFAVPPLCPELGDAFGNQVPVYAMNGFHSSRRVYNVVELGTFVSSTNMTGSKSLTLLRGPPCEPSVVGKSKPVETP